MEEMRVLLACCGFGFVCERERWGFAGCLLRGPSQEMDLLTGALGLLVGWAGRRGGGRRCCLEIFGWVEAIRVDVTLNYYLKRNIFIIAIKFFYSIS
jgi:hypothetical protein